MASNAAMPMAAMFSGAMSRIASSSGFGVLYPVLQYAQVDHVHARIDVLRIEAPGEQKLVLGRLDLAAPSRW